MRCKTQHAMRGEGDAMCQCGCYTQLQGSSEFPFVKNPSNLVNEMFSPPSRCQNLLVFDGNRVFNEMRCREDEENCISEANANTHLHERLVMYLCTSLWGWEVVSLSGLLSLSEAKTRKGIGDGDQRSLNSPCDCPAGTQCRLAAPQAWPRISGVAKVQAHVGEA